MAQSRRNGSSHRSRTVVMTKPARASTSTPARGNGRTPGPSATALIHELGSCVTETDLVQVLYRGLHGRFGYDVINLQVLEREGWYHSLPMDAGVLQDVRRRPVRESMFARQFANPKTTVMPVETARQQIGKGPGAGVTPKLAIWVPVMHQGELIGSVSYQSFRKRRVAPAELEFLEDVHRRLGVLLVNASLNELTRNQARRLEALNSIARAMTSTLDEASVLSGLYATLRELLPVDTLEMVTLPEGTDRARYMQMVGDSLPTSRWLTVRSAHTVTARDVVAGNKPVLAHYPHSSLWVPLKESGGARGALGINFSRPYAYEASTGAFMELVSDEVTLALRNARSYGAIEAQRRRLEVVNAVGRRLASSLDRWSIARALQEELSHHLEFDIFSLATITETTGGPVAQGYVYDSGEERPLVAVPLAEAGPSREAYATGESVLLQRSPWARQLESERRGRGRVATDGALMTVTRP